MSFILQVVDAATSLKQVVLRRPRTVVGRKKGCKIRIRSERVSRIHCSLVCHEGRLTIKDLSSSNGTFVNGKRIAECELQEGDVIEIGPIKFTVQRDSASARRRPAEPSTVHESADDDDVVFFETDDAADAGDDIAECVLVDEDKQPARTTDPSPGTEVGPNSIFDSDSEEVADAEDLVVPEDLIDEKGYRVRDDS